MLQLLMRFLGRPPDAYVAIIHDYQNSGKPLTEDRDRWRISIIPIYQGIPVYYSRVDEVAIFSHYTLTFWKKMEYRYHPKFSTARRIRILLYEDRFTTDASLPFEIEYGPEVSEIQEGKIGGERTQHAHAHIGVLNSKEEAGAWIERTFVAVFESQAFIMAIVERDRKDKLSQHR